MNNLGVPERVTSCIIEQQEGMFGEDEVKLLQKTLFSSPEITEIEEELIKHFRLEIVNIFFHYGVILGNNNIDRLLNLVSENDMRRLKDLICYLREVESVHKDIPTEFDYCLDLILHNRNSAEINARQYPILNDLGDGVRDPSYGYNPVNPAGHGRCYNDAVMKTYRSKIEDALISHGYVFSSDIIDYLKYLPFNGHQASQIIVFVIDCWNKGERNNMVQLLRTFAEKQNWWNKRYRPCSSEHLIPLSV